MERFSIWNARSATGTLKAYGTPEGLMERRRLWNARSAIGTTWNYLELFGTPQASSLLLGAMPLL